jgi:hypothetical protein
MPGVEEDVEERAGPTHRRRVVTAFAAGIVAGGLAIGLTLVGWSAWSSARAQTPGPSPGAPQMLPGKAWPDGMKPRPGGGRLGPGFPGLRLGGPGFRVGPFGGGGLHGEITTKKQGGGYQTLAMQAGEVTSVSSSSIALRSEDGFDRTYSVDAKTRVRAGTNGISDVNKGDNVRVLAVVEGNRARALQVVDLSNLKDLRGRSPMKPGQAPPPQSST